MNTHDIELPPLPVGTTSPMVHGAYYYASDMHDYAREAIEPYTKRIAALEAARIAYASEFAPNKDGDPDVGRIHENIRKLKADRKRRGEPVAWQLRLPDGRVKLEKEYPAWADGSDGYSIKPLYATPQPTEPTPTQKRHARLRTDPAFVALDEILAGIEKAASEGKYEYITRNYGFGSGECYTSEDKYPVLCQAILKELRALGFKASVQSECRQFVDLWLSVTWEKP